MKKILIATAIAATALSASPVMAAVYSSAKLSNYQFDLVDLNVNDDLTPSIVFNGPKRNAISGMVINDAGINQGFNSSSDSVTDGISQAFGNGNGGVSAFASAGLFSTSFLGASGSTTGAYPHGELGNYSAFSINSLDFTLSPFTQLNIFVKSNIEREITFAGEFSQSFSQVSIEGTNTSATHNPITSTDTFSINEELMLNLVFDNFSIDAFNGVLLSYAQSNGHSTAPSSVPVPAALPLMASAMGLFGFGAMRRKSSKS